MVRCAAIATLLALASCDSSSIPAGCRNVTCGGNGRCVVDSNGPRCLCNAGFAVQDLDCIAMSGGDSSSGGDAAMGDPTPGDEAPGGDPASGDALRGDTASPGDTFTPSFVPSHLAEPITRPAGANAQLNLDQAITYTLDTTNGQFSDGGAGGVRAAGVGVIAGIGYELLTQASGNGPSVAVVSLDAMTLGTNATLRITGDYPLVLWVNETTIAGTVSAGGIGPVPGAGGAPGPLGNQNGSGPGAGPRGSSDGPLGVCDDNGGSGAGFAGLGGIGGQEDQSGCEDAPGAGPTYGGPCFETLHAGSSGGGGRPPGGAGGAGGGGIQISAEVSIAIASTGVINVGGGGGSPLLESGGGGGGSGGQIWLESPSVTVDGILAANGGSGADGSGSMVAAPGIDGLPSTDPAGGVMGPSDGGGGGALANVAGERGSDGNSGGGGGGAAGFICIRSASASLPGTPVAVSPAPTVEVGY